MGRINLKCQLFFFYSPITVLRKSEENVQQVYMGEVFIIF